MDGVLQNPGKSPQNFNNNIRYTLFGKDGQKKTYYTRIRGYNGIPIVAITTKDSIAILSNENYVEANLRIFNDPEHGIIEQNCKIRGRGNSSWANYPKKPYKIKAFQKISPFGFYSNKDWVLLADYTDKSLIRTAFISELSKAMGIEFTINYRHVELFVNGDYLGVYCFTDQVERGKNRVNIEKDGFLIEDDTYYAREPLFLKSDLCGYNFTFKYPDADDESFNENHHDYIFIKDFITLVSINIC